MPSMPHTYFYLNIDFTNYKNGQNLGNSSQLMLFRKSGCIGRKKKKCFHFFSSSEGHIAFAHNGIVLTETYFIVFVASILCS